MTSIDYETAHRLALMCRESTCPWIDFSRYRYPNTEILMCNATNTVVVLCGGHVPVLVFGSTDDVWECCFDGFLMPFKEVDSGIRVNSTMHGLWIGLRHLVLGHIRSWNAEKIYVTGHSTAGAVALLAALDIAKNHRPVKPVVRVFGTPRVGDGRFCRELRELVPDAVSFEHPGDPVPRMPRGEYDSRIVRVVLGSEGAALLRILHMFPMVGRMFLYPYNEPSVYIDSLFGYICT